MKKQQPAKKGSGTFKDKRSDKYDKPAGNRNRSSADGERPGRASAKDNSSSDDKPFRKRSFDGDKTSADKPSFRKRSFDGDKTSGDKPAFRKRSFDGDKTGDDKPAFRKRSFDGDKTGDDKPAFRKRSFDGDKTGDDKPSFRKRSFDGDKTDGDKPSFRKRSFDGPKPERKRSFDTDKKSDDKPARKRIYTSFKKDDINTDQKSGFGEAAGGSDKPARKRSFGSDKKATGRKTYEPKKSSDDSVFHFHGDSGKGKKGDRKETPSGFNRKKFFDRTNDRFADKQERSKGSKKRTTNDNEHTKNPTKASKESSFGPGEMPLNKYIAHCGLCSRRKAVDFIKEGKVTVNGKVITEPATKVTASDTVTMQDKKVHLTKNLVYILLNKPKGYITTTDDPEGRKTVMDLVQEAAENERVYPVGRLDRNTSGLLLLTNDGELAQRLAHPKHNIKKIYQVELEKPLTKGDFEKIIDGVTLEDGVALVDALGYVDPKDKKQIGIEIHSGKNRIVRRIFEHLGYSVEKLDRVMYAGLTKKTLNRGQWRFLTEKEVILLKHFKK
ncbi:pseudouridine synthase [Chitinophaga nivalis]|uniref:Pseudouridine synthase n=1 Tax=Chitinophaga nivalis TaxID=2991709 RepID=A0ABT3IXB3_9BACT|nr:pseudouridine synthase [Chitinophaga nivalis]MCW3461945.1 rRNA pseudouridine synthase [Chitinophaga nivalis]MCW3488364.1 rRNA pseudouridine synthase [Chitinophaga nivalis]